MVTFLGFQRLEDGDNGTVVRRDAEPQRLRLGRGRVLFRVWIPKEGQTASLTG